VKSHNELIIRNGQTILKLSDSLFILLSEQTPCLHSSGLLLSKVLSLMHIAVTHKQHFSLLNLRHSRPCSSLVPQIFQLDAQVCFLVDERLIWLELKSIVSIFLLTFGVSALLCIV